MLPLNLDPGSGEPLRLLCLGAHCDDIEIGAGGTILRLLAEREVDVRWHVFTSEPARALEARASAEAFLGGARRSEVSVGELPASFLPAHFADLKQSFFELRQSFTPDLILTHHLADRHQDHRMVAELTWQTYRDHTTFAYEIPKYEGDLGQPNLYVPLSREQADAKVAAILASFPSQASHSWFDADTFQAMLRLRGLECNAASGRAEAFHAPKLVL